MDLRGQTSVLGEAAVSAAVELRIGIGSGTFVLALHGSPGRTLIVETTDHLAGEAWIELGRVTLGQDGVAEVPLPSLPHRATAFFRAVWAER